MATNNENHDQATNTPSAVPDNEQLQKDKEFKEEMSNGKDVNDPSALRNTGAGGYTQRADQKDQLANLHIGGGEGVPQGGNDHENAGEQASGPGFEAEGSYDLGNGVRSQEQDFGEKEPSGPAKPAHD